MADDLDAALRPRRAWKPVAVTGVIVVVLVVALGAMLLWNPFRPQQPVEQNPPNAEKKDDATPATELRSFRGHVGPVRCVAFHPDGKRVASGGADATVRLWTVDGTDAEAVVLKQTTGVTSLAFTPDGKTLACGYDNGNIRLWDAAKNKEGVTIPAHKGSVTAMSFSAEQKFLASGGADGIVRIFVMGQATGATIPKHADTVLSLTFGTKGYKLTTGYGHGPSKPGKVLLSEIVTIKGNLKIANTGEGNLVGINDVRFITVSQDGDTVLAATTKAVHVWRKQKEGLAVVGAFTRTAEPISALALSPDSRIALSCGADNRLHLWDVETLKQVEVFAGHTQLVRCLGFSADGTLAVSGDEGGMVRLWQIKAEE